jgi:hypothetical protein
MQRAVCPVAWRGDIVRRGVAGCGAMLAGAWPLGAHAHAFGARYDLPLPLGLYLGAAGAAVAASFLLPLSLLRSPPPATAPQAETATVRGWPVRALRVLAVALLALLFACALAGPASPTANLATVFVWVLWWVGLGLVQALLLDLWSLANPWYALAGVCARVLPRPLPRPYPAWLACWPAVAGFALFAWLELVSSVGEQPRALAALIGAYTLLTLAGAWCFGRGAWFASADSFAVLFATLGRMAPLVVEGARLRARLPGAGLLVHTPVPASLGVLVLMLLATVFFDGFRETTTWAAVLDAVAASALLRAPLLALQGSGLDLLVLVESAGLALSVLLFASAFIAVAALVDRASGRPAGLRRCAGSFVLTLVPIAIAYHLAHYLSYLLIAGQLAIPLASDPFARGWDLFGTAGYSIDIAIVDARFVWYAAVASIVAGHALAVFLAHAMALRLYREPVPALRSQLPMLALMVGYTMSSLWILSQPIVVS